MQARGLLPVLLFLSAAAGTALLGSRVVAAERVSAERTARERLRARAQAGAAALGAEASRLMREAAFGTPDAVTRDDGSRTPAAPRPLGRLPGAPPSDSEGAFYLEQGERAEVADREPDRAAGLYAAAAGEGRDPSTRAAALFRLAALERRRGREEEARAHERRFLDTLPTESSGTFEALAVRARLGERGPAIEEAILLGLGAGDDEAVRGLLREVGAAEAAIAKRRSELILLGRIDRAGPTKTPTGAELVLAEFPEDLEPSIVAWSSIEGATRWRVGPVPALPEAVWLLREKPSEVKYWMSDIKESASAADPLQGEQVVACDFRAAVEEEARRGALMLGGALLALLGAGATALILAVRASRREADAARVRADFVTRVGHDLRTPLSKVRMYAETVAAGRTTGPEEAREFAGVAAREAEVLTGMVDRILDFSRAAAGPVAGEERDFDLAEMTAEVAAWHRPLLERDGIALAVRVDGALPVRGDSAALRAAVSNLVENAARHAASGRSIEVEARRNGRTAEVRVLDRGPGLPPGMGERLFERFVRGPGTEGPGAGLGLALVREAAESHGGRARASNRGGGGAEFALEIPIREGEA